MSDLIRYIPFTADLPAELPSVLCLGNFDGLHKGHAALIQRTLKIRNELLQTGLNVRAGVLFFDTPPADYFVAAKIPHLMSLDQKIESFKDTGLDGAYICNFSRIKDLSPLEFVNNILRDKCHCIGSVCGFNFRFGKNAEGNAELLTSQFNGEFPSAATSAIVPPIRVGGEIVSSSRIRDMISDGDMEGASAMLGRHFFIDHEVVHGKHLGTQLGFPTVNHILNEIDITPATGIYATQTLVGNKIYQSVTNIGIRPTVSDSKNITCETHIIDLDDSTKDLYGKKVRIIFFAKLREETKFSSVQELSSAIAADIESVKYYFKRSDNNS